MSRFESWLERSRLNPAGLLRMRRPTISAADAEAFDRLLAATPRAGRSTTTTRSRSGSSSATSSTRISPARLERAGIEEFRTRPQRDAHGNPIEALFASDDAIWPLYFAVVRREGNTYGYINWCVHVRDESRYLFSIGRDPQQPEAWTEGWIYVLPGETFKPTPKAVSSSASCRCGPARGYEWSLTTFPSVPGRCVTARMRHRTP